MFSFIDGQKTHSLALFPVDSAPGCLMYSILKYSGHREEGTMALFPLMTIPFSTASSSQKLKNGTPHFGQTFWIKLETFWRTLCAHEVLQGVVEISSEPSSPQSQAISPFVVQHCTVVHGRGTFLFIGEH